MNWKLICEISIKVVTAAVAGIAVFVGVDQAISRGRNGSSNNRQIRNGGDPRINNKPYEDPFNHVPPTGSGIEQSSGQVMLSGLKGATTMCSKLLTFTQSLTSLAENFARIFKDTPGYDYYQGPGYCCGPGGYGNYQEMGGQSWRRLSPFVIEAAPCGNYSRNQQYPF